MDQNTLIDILGGTKKVADLCEISMSSVSEWRTKGIPKARLLFFKAIRPDLFQERQSDNQDSVAA